ncbi:hypothetical protein [Microbacterium sp. A93]|uniref:hypothetical protein n=1 Tax=Microbacterium sp. A93 TaxID=3450716 RepID=UPI003F437BC8
MTDVDDRPPPPFRHKQPWTELDLAAAMEAVREDCPLEDIAERIGRTPMVLRNQLRRMLPADERRLRADLIQARLRQLNRDGDYDWLAAMAQQPTPEWTLREQAHQRSLAALVDGARSVGVGALSDNDLIMLATAILDSQGGFPTELRQIVSTLIHERELVHQLDRWMRARSTRALELLMAEAVRGPDDEWRRFPPDPYDEELAPWER